jgi:hypothetical protein
LRNFTPPFVEIWTATSLVSGKGWRIIWPKAMDLLGVYLRYFIRSDDLGGTRVREKLKFMGAICLKWIASESRRNKSFKRHRTE